MRLSRPAIPYSKFSATEGMLLNYSKPSRSNVWLNRASTGTNRHALLFLCHLMALLVGQIQSSMKSAAAALYMVPTQGCWLHISIILRGLLRNGKAHVSTRPLVRLCCETDREQKHSLSENNVDVFQESGSYCRLDQTPIKKFPLIRLYMLLTVSRVLPCAVVVGSIPYLCRAMIPFYVQELENAIAFVIPHMNGLRVSHPTAAQHNVGVGGER
jgi:hypothetical protein